MKNITYIH